MATGDLIYSSNHRVFALGQDPATASTTWWADFYSLTPGSGKFFLRDEGSGFGSGPAPQVNPFGLNHTYTLAVYEGSIAAVPGAVYQRTFEVTGVSSNYAVGATAAGISTLNLTDASTPGGLGSDDPSQSVNSASVAVAIPTPVASQYTIVAVLVA